MLIKEAVYYRVAPENPSELSSSRYFAQATGHVLRSRLGTVQKSVTLKGIKWELTEISNI